MVKKVKKKKSKQDKKRISPRNVSKKKWPLINVLRIWPAW